MPKVICDLENAADEISGVKFNDLEEGGKISEEISEEQAEHFLGISGYSLAEGSSTSSAKTAPAAPSADEIAAKTKDIILGLVSDADLIPNMDVINKALKAAGLPNVKAADRDAILAASKASAAPAAPSPVQVEDDGAATRAQLDEALAALPADYVDPDAAVTDFKTNFASLFTADDEAKVRELVKAPGGAEGGKGAAAEEVF